MDVGSNKKVRGLLNTLADRIESEIDTIDRSIDPYKLDSYLASIQDNLLKVMIQGIIVQTQYISFSTFIKEMRSIATKIDLDSFSIYIDIEDPIHSEFWCLAIIWPIIKMKVSKIFTHIDQITNEYPILIVDDCIYSALRIGGLIRYINNRVPGKLCFYICTAYSTSAIQILLPKQISGDFLFPEYADSTDMSKLSVSHLCENIIMPLLCMYKDTWTCLEKLFSVGHCCLPIYFDHKVAECNSSFPDLYQEIIKAPPNRGPILDMEQLMI